MLELAEIVAVEKKLCQTQVLSVYVNSTMSNPAERMVWRKELDKGISDAREKLSRASAAEKRDFERAVSDLLHKLPDDEAVHASRGWAGFFPANGEGVTQHLPTSVPNMVVWDTGIRVAPLVRAQKQLTPVIVVLADSRMTQLYRYHEGKLEELGSIEAEAVIGPVSHMGDAPRQGFHVGKRGTAGADEADRAFRTAKEKMYRELEERLLKLADNDSWIVVGGTSEACSDIENLVPARLKERVLVNQSLHMKSRQAELSEAAKTGASELRKRSDANLIETIAELAGARGRGAVGLKPTLNALRDHSVQTLLFTTRLMETHGSVAETLVRLALHQGAELEHVTGDAAIRLDEDFDGVAARLRFVAEKAQAVS